MFALYLRQRFTYPVATTAPKMKRKSEDSLSPPPWSAKRRRSDLPLVPVNLRGMKSGEVAKDTGRTTDQGDDEGDEEEGALLEEDDYTAHQKWQSQTKQNLHVLMDNFTPDQHDRYDQYRRSAINKNTVRKFVQHTFGTNPTPNVAQVISGFSKVFVGEIVEKAREVQMNRGSDGPLAPEDLREAYRLYTEANGKIGAALPNRGKRLFSR